MSNGSGGKRITLKRSRPNPIFEDWLKELHEEAKGKKSKLEPMLKEALESITKYPLPLKSGAECAILKGFDKKLCKFLDIRLEAYYSNTNDSERGSEANVSPQTTGLSKGSIKSSTSTKSSNSDSTNTSDDIGSLNNLCTDSAPIDSTTGQSKKDAKRPRIFKPVFRSGSYAILVALLKQLRDNPSKSALEKQELINLAQPHSEESFSRLKPDSFYTAWSNMKTLISKKLVVCTRSKKNCYSLSDEGIALAIQVLDDYKDRPTVNDIIFNGASTSNLNPMRYQDNLTSGGSTTSSQTVTPVLSQVSATDSVFIDMPADTFDVILLIDKNETGGVSKKNDPTVAQFKKYTDLKHEYRSLKVGDFTWIARHKDNKGHELVLPYIVERKRMDDFGASIKDGRFHEQKFRLRKCGLYNVIYLVENYGSNKHVGLPFQSLMQALANTRVQDVFKVHVTDSLNNSARFLAMMTKRLTIEYKDKHLLGRNQESQGEELMTFDYFNKASSKSKPLTVTEMFIKLLVQLKGLSVEKALAITKVYSTPKSLITEYEKCTQKEGETLLANLKYGTQTRNVGPKISKSIYKFLVWKE